MLCKTCGVNTVDGRKTNICTQCVKKEEEERQRKEVQRQIEQARIEKLLDQILKPAEIRKAIWNSQYTRRQLIDAVAYSLISNDAHNFDIYYKAQSKGKEQTAIYSLWGLLESTDQWREFFWKLRRKVEKEVDEMYQRMRGF